MPKAYRGRIAPSPTGYLHVGHAITFWCAQERARAENGRLILRMEDLDLPRSRPEFSDAVIEDLKWFGFEWDEGPDVGGFAGPYVQHERRAHYLEAWQELWSGGSIYPCQCSRKDVIGAAIAPHDENEEPVYPGTCRPRNLSLEAAVSAADIQTSQARRLPPKPSGVHWRFHVPDGEELRFVDERSGEQCAVAGRDFGDFIVWRKDDVPAYQLAVVVDDAAMGITEVVRGEDLVISTFRQLLIYRALGLEVPRFYHARLIVDDSGKRLAKRHDSLSLRELRKQGVAPAEIRSRYFL